ncbi:MAG: RNA methyltransferase [Clostridia bacterium]|nr:RNA methyltransferase [Clostridia bacterium]
MNSFNKVFIDRMKMLLGKDFPKFFDALQQDPVKALCVNENKISVERFKQVVDFAVEPIKYEKCGFYVDNEKKGRHPLHHAGAFYLQEPSAMFTVNAYNFKGTEKVLDLCAAPGGKTIQIANRIKNGVLVSNEIDTQRNKALFSNVERMGLDNVIICNDTPQNLAKAYANTFDVCLVDAPCSGEGMFRRGEEVTSEWNANLPVMCATRQWDIVKEADKMLKQGGILIYATCTYSLEENEVIVKKVIDELGYDIIDIDADFLNRGVDFPEAVRLYPHVVKGEGQFVAVLKKTGKNELVAGRNAKINNSTLANKFIAENTRLNVKCYEMGEYVYAVKDVNLIKSGVKYTSLGVRVGRIENKRFEPEHYLFSAFGKNFLRKIDLKLGDEFTQKYLKGETFNYQIDDGYGTILLEGCSLGGFKAVKGIIKNHYPKGLRNFK